MKTALITGITGQDGSYLAEFLLARHYKVHGLVRRASTSNTSRIDHLLQDPAVFNQKLFLHVGDLTDGGSLFRLVESTEPDEIYHLASQSHVRVSFEVPEQTGDVTGLGTVRLLEAMRRFRPEARFYQASSSEMYGAVQEVPQRESTPFAPRNPYAAAKLYAHWMTINYRESYGLFACNGILFNHESPRRGEMFVTRKITLAAARIQAGCQDRLFLGNLGAKRDWGYAPEYVDAMWRMLQQPQPDDYVIATGESHTVQEFIETAFSRLGLNWREFVTTDPRLLRPTEVNLLVGDASKARRVLGWEPATTFEGLVQLMVDADVQALHGVH